MNRRLIMLVKRFLHEYFASDVSSGPSPADVQAQADSLAREAGIEGGAVAAFRMLDAGELDGTMLEVELKKLRFQQRKRDRKSDPDRAHP